MRDRWEGGGGGVRNWYLLENTSRKKKRNNNSFNLIFIIIIRHTPYWYPWARIQRIHSRAFIRKIFSLLLGKSDWIESRWNNAKNRENFIGFCWSKGVKKGGRRTRGLKEVKRIVWQSRIQMEIHCRPGLPLTTRENHYKASLLLAGMTSDRRWKKKKDFNKYCGGFVFVSKEFDRFYYKDFSVSPSQLIIGWQKKKKKNYCRLCVPRSCSRQFWKRKMEWI